MSAFAVAGTRRALARGGRRGYDQRDGRVCLTGVFIVFLIYRSDRRIVGGQPMEKGLPHSRIFWWSSPVTSTVTYDRACAYPPQPWISSWALRQSKK